MNSSTPAALASSTAYWVSGRSTIGSISFGIALVAGRLRVPSPATGNTALRTVGCMALLDDGQPAAPLAAEPEPRLITPRRRNRFRGDITGTRFSTNPLTAG